MTGPNIPPPSPPPINPGQRVPVTPVPFVNVDHLEKLKIASLEVKAIPQVFQSVPKPEDIRKKWTYQAAAAVPDIVEAPKEDKDRFTQAIQAMTQRLQAAKASPSQPASVAPRVANERVPLASRGVLPQTLKPITPMQLKSVTSVYKAPISK